MAENVDVVGISAMKMSVIGTGTEPDVCGTSGVVGLTFLEGTLWTGKRFSVTHSRPS